MALFKCKMCGGDLKINEGATIAECEYCGTKQTVPKATDENLQNSFNRANTLRIKSEFDKAERIYEKIIQADSTQSDAYWGLILCKYGIEYVDDPDTYKKVPTCHRTSFDSILDDEDYQSAIENADNSQRYIYEEQAREIDRIQKEILALARNEEPYDVFICYKETDASGKRTQDSVIANDIYHQLIGEGFKVFYAAITLEGKLGSAYEPIIFAALHSAKVMLVIGTKPEYLNAVWVKNEWSRFLKMNKKDRSKLLIPCYRDMDAYELPEEFAHLQAQDMSKIGFITDLVRGIKKVVDKSEPKTTVVRETVIAPTNVNIAPLLERMKMFLEDRDWKSAEECAEKVLDQEPKCSEAYFGKLLAHFKVPNIEELRKLSRPIYTDKNYEKIIRFGDEEQKNTLIECSNYINTHIEGDRLEKVYVRAITIMQRANTELEYTEAVKMFVELKDYKDSKARLNECVEKRDKVRNERIYQGALFFMNRHTLDDVKIAIEKFSQIPGYKDADIKLAECHNMIPELENKIQTRRTEQQQLKNTAKKAAPALIGIGVGTVVIAIILVVVILLCIGVGALIKNIFSGISDSMDNLDDSSWTDDEGITLTNANFGDYFTMNISSEYDGDKLVLSYSIKPRSTAYEANLSSSSTITVKLKGYVYLSEYSTSPLNSTTQSITLYKYLGYEESGTITLYVNTYAETVYWKTEVTSANGTIYE